MERAIVESSICEMLLDRATVEAEAITTNATLADDLGVPSYNMLVVRESLERMFSIFIADSDFDRLDRVSSIVDLVMEKHEVLNASVGPPSVPSSTPAPSIGGSSLGPDDTLITEIEIGMPLTGRNNLAETPLLREVGNLRWQHMSLVSGVLSKDVVDEDSERLYPTFFFVEVAFPQSRPMATYGENDTFTIVSTLRRYGISILDGEHFLFPGHWPRDKKIPFYRCEDSLDAGVPFVRLSNNFVKQWSGAAWLNKSRPVHPGFHRIREMSDPPDTYTESLLAKEAPGFFEIPETFTPLTPSGGVVVEYNIVPDRDLNGAGLLYFANYPMFLDIAERSTLRSLGELSFEEELIDLRTLLHRKSAYFSNAMSSDTLRINTKAWVENPYRAGVPDPNMAPIRLLLDYEMYRCSNERLMLKSSAKKIVLGRSLGETSLLERLQKSPGRP